MASHNDVVGVLLNVPEGPWVSLLGTLRDQVLADNEGPVEDRRGDGIEPLTDGPHHGEGRQVDIAKLCSFPRISLEKDDAFIELGG